MGRFRNLSANFTAAFLSKEDLNSSSTPPERNNRSGHELDKDHPVLAKAPSGPPLNDTPSVNGATSRPTSSRPSSGIYTSPSGLDMSRDTQVEELVPVFSYLSSHANKLYQEGYFLKLTDLDTNGKPNADRNWTECFAQLVGTILSLWDAAALDAAGADGEVAPTFLNLADASIRMIETLPTRNADVQPLQNVLSISTAGKNRYLLHFNSLHSLTQWTAGIRLAMFENASLQELYTGSLIAGKGKHLNNIRHIMERSKFAWEDWVRVRFGAGTPWRRCWCVIEPPDEKEWQKATKSLKKKSAYERPSFPKGEIKFYDTKKTKKVEPIASITDAHSCYAIYPQAKPLIEQSTLVKLEGRITIHSKPESRTEGFVFVMPEIHAAVSGFEMMLRWLFPVYDAFHMYGRPSRLIADSMDTRGLMFAMPKERRYGYLEIMDVASLIHTEGSDKWTEREWCKQMKESTAKRMQLTSQNRGTGGLDAPTMHRDSLGSRNGVHYDDAASVRSSPSANHQYNQSTDAVHVTPMKISKGPAGASYLRSGQGHSRSVSESVPSPSKLRRQQQPYVPSRLSMDHQLAEEEVSDYPPINGMQSQRGQRMNQLRMNEPMSSSDTELVARRTQDVEDIEQEVREQTPPGPVVAPPVFQHQANEPPRRRPDVRPDLRREKSRMSDATLHQMADVTKMRSQEAAGQAAMIAWRNGRPGEDQDRGVNNGSLSLQTSANRSAPVVADTYTSSPLDSRPMTRERTNSAHSVSRKPLPQAMNQEPMPSMPMGSSTYSHAQPISQTIRDARPPPQSQAQMYDTQNSSVGAREYPTHRQGDVRIGDARWERTTSRQRGGQLRTVGDPNATAQDPSIDIPAVDFGVTKSLTSTPEPSRPGSAAGTRSPLEQTTPPDRRSTSVPASPDDNRRSYVDRSNPRPSHSRSNSVAWRPGTVAGRQSPGPGLTPEEYVQHRAAAARHPQGYAPIRTVSASKLEQQSPNKLQKKRESYSRPESRGSPTTPDFSSKLTAREQEHVARMTGGPLLNMPARNQTPDPQVGLIGSIEQREQEKRNMKQGLAGQMVQEAIMNRQQHAQAQAIAAQRAHDRAYGPSFNSMATTGPLQPPQPMPNAMQQQQWTGQQYAHQQQYQQSQQYASQALQGPQQYQQQQAPSQPQGGYYANQNGYGGQNYGAPNGYGRR